MTQAQGGIISYANGKKIHTFESSGTFVITEAGDVEVLIVAGGGAGGGDFGMSNTAFGGGGGGGVIYTSALSVGVGNVDVVVGEGGIATSTGFPYNAVAAQNSYISDGNINFLTQTAIRGGTSNQDGGSGGGDGGYGSAGLGTVGQGHDGGAVTNFFTGGAGGGGGGSAGSNAPAVNFTDQAGAGGDGYLSSISGTAQRYGAGGGGGAWKRGNGLGGLGGGGNGGWADFATQTGELPTPGTGYGAGGGGQGGNYGVGRIGGAGHKGVVIFSYDSDFTTGRRVAQNEDLADMTASTIKGRIASTGIPQDLTAAQVATILDTEITERAQDAVGAMVADTATIDLTYTDATPELKADVKVDSINDTHIDWGTGTNQVSLDDVPDGATRVLHDAATVADTASIDLTLTGQQISAAAIFGTSAGVVAEGNHAHGSTYQPLDPELTALAGLASAADKGIQFTGAGTAGTYTLTTAGRAILDDADATAQRATLGLVIGTDVQAQNANLSTIGALTPTDDDVIQRKAGAWINRTIAQLVTDIRTVIDSVFAPIAKGVTNGDSHDHAGGDGAQIAHTGLSSIGTNTHAQIDTHLANTSNPHSVTAAQAGAVELVSGNANIASGKTYNINGAAHTHSLTSAFIAYNSATISNVTGDGTEYVIVFDGEVNDTASDYDASTGIFTARYSGTHLFTTNALLRQLHTSGTHTEIDLFFRHTSGAVVRDFMFARVDVPTAFADFVLQNTTTIYMTAGDTCKVVTAVYGGGKVVDVFGQTGNGQAYTRFTGVYLG